MVDVRHLARVGGYAPDDAPSRARLRGWRLGLYQNSLLLWQSEFLAVGGMAAFTI